MQKKRFLLLLLPLVTLILEILPYGAVCNFANPEGEPLRKTFSYFDLTPFGYANVAPFLTAIATCLILGALLLYLFIGKTKALTLATVLLCVGVLLSLCPLCFGFRFFSVVGGLITASLLAELAFIIITKKAFNKCR